MQILLWLDAILQSRQGQIRFKTWQKKKKKVLCGGEVEHREEGEAGNAAARRPPHPLRKWEPLSWAGQGKSVSPCGSLKKHEKTENTLKSK